MNRVELAKKINHTLLKPDATLEQIARVCDEAIAAGCASVCVNGNRVEAVAERLEGSGVLTAAVVGFPLGAMSTEAKALEAGLAVADGARELDMVIDVAAVKERDDDRAKRDIQAVVEAANEAHAGVAVKVILETGLLTDEEKSRAAELAVDAGASFVKTSTGFIAGGATVEDVRILRRAVGDRAQVKASGGIKDLETALAMIEAGADRLGMSATVPILEQCGA